jgi:hypothetical protein
MISQGKRSTAFAVAPALLKLMKYLLAAAFSFILFSSGVKASEFLGTISTDPHAYTGSFKEPPPESPAEQAASSPATAEKPKTGSNSGWIYQNKNSSTASKDKTDSKLSSSKNNKKAEDEVKVLGISHYADGVLLRDRSHKIYFVKGNIKKHITNLEELKKYAGRAIFSASDEELSKYQAREHLDGELIREKASVKIYSIRQGRKQHILNLEELRVKFRGLEIFNISREEMLEY